MFLYPSGIILCHANVSNYKCALPVFEGLLPEPHNTIILDLLFTLCEWHAMAKLRLHTDSSLADLRSVTYELGRLLRLFKDRTCAAFDTKELPREEEARARRKRAKKAKANGAASASAPLPTPFPKISKAFNLSTYKLHALGDYVLAILRYGTSDSYSTQVVSFFFFFFIYLSLHFMTLP